MANNGAHKDASKWALLVPEKMLVFVHMWPDTKNFSKKVIFWIMWITIVLLEMGQLLYLLKNLHNITAVAEATSTFSTTFQAICKMMVLFVHSDTLKKIIHTIWYDFWPSNSMGRTIEKTLLFNGYLAVSIMIMVFVSAIVFAIGFLSAPIREGKHDLPFLAWYPFNWKGEPLYGILYVTECFVNIYVIIISICGHDNLFLAICTNCIAQFKMLKVTAGLIGTEDGKKINHTLQKFISAKTYKNDNDETAQNEERQLLVKCVRHHIKLMRLCKDVEEVFTLSTFTQLICSTAAICVSSFMIVMIGRSAMIHLMSYCFGHILQLFMFCAPANELSYQQQTLTKYFYKCGWYTNKNVKLKKDLITVMQFSQKNKTMSTLGVIPLNYSTFVGVLRLSFSFYTLLSKLTKK